ncbi:putative dehydrogenase [Desulfocapsa sulfexigens DSM 10523]|uniref:Putative dehydrogenase n=1 Tax=Desulfocapsa sulfexigens (strain DSM 10523 / SB164P1) TaxID=1167006 RepID=M1P664_DESSD|nr:Gfo/Idh/MocA family oxidoreductase [Desulfocapsa sulfexigens]AGF78943.1 putative dehydrogenase [Desulfocapsa sulfexigens DSM 10523]
MDTLASNIAVVGSGYWGKNLVRNFNTLEALHTICDTNKTTLTRFEEQYPGINTATAYSQILTNPEIQGVAIATPAETHATLATEALLAGKDVYIEKPLCLSEKEGAELNALAKRQNCVLMVGHLLWYHPVVLKLKELVDAGELGRIQYIYSNRLNLGKLRREENVLWSFAPHDISVILGLTGEMPESIRAQGGNYLHRQIADTTMTLMNFSSGIKAHIFVSWLHPFKEQKLVVVGEKQMAVFDDVAPWDDKLLLYPHSIKWSDNIPVANKAEAVKVTVKQDEPLKAECAHFLDCIKNRSKPRTDGEEGLRVLKVLNRCQESLENEQKVQVTSHSNQADFFCHESAVVDSGVDIGSNSKIWHFSHILSGSKIGCSCNIGQNVVVGPNVTIGDRCKIQNNVSVYEGVSIGDEVFCGPSMVFTNVMNPRAAISRKDEYCDTVVRRGVTFGANCTIVGGIEIAEYAFIGAGAVVVKSVPAFALMVGNPARQIGWMSKYGKKMDLPLTGHADFTCPFTGEKYTLRDDCVTVVPE